MKSLVVYYSRTGNTEKVAYEIARQLTATIEKITDRTDRTGMMGWLKAGRDGMAKNKTEIGPVTREPSQFDLIILGTPVWVGMTPAIRTYIAQHRLCFSNVAFFCTMDGNTNGVFADMADACGKQPLATLAVRSADAVNNLYAPAVHDFAVKLR
jgi:flavodoxin